MILQTFWLKEIFFLVNYTFFTNTQVRKEKPTTCNTYFLYNRIFNTIYSFQTDQLSNKLYKYAERSPSNKCCVMYSKKKNYSADGRLVKQENKRESCKYIKEYRRACLHQYKYHLEFTSNTNGLNKCQKLEKRDKLWKWRKLLLV